jgi:iron complex outermembrane receptor protein
LFAVLSVVAIDVGAQTALSPESELQDALANETDQAAQQLDEVMQHDMSLPMGQLEEVLVSAQKTSQTLQDVPISISAFGRDTIQQWDLSDVYRIEALTPGLGASSFSLGQPQLYIRGIGSNEDGAGGDPSVSVYLDGVYIARPSANTLAFNDIERIEVLRGPQGTLYGKNAVGGVINVISRQPSAQEETELELSLGELDLNRLKFRTNMPLSDRLFTSFSFLSDSRSGYVLNKTSGNDLHNVNDQAARWQMRLDFADDSELIVALDVDHADRLGSARRASGRITELSSGASLDAQSMYPENPYEVSADIDGYQKRLASGARIELNHRVDAYTFTSLTGLRQSHYRWLEDLDGTLTANTYGFSSSSVNNRVDEQAEQYSQEFRLSFDADRYSWVSGFYALKEHTHRNEDFEFFSVFGLPVPFTNFLLDGSGAPLDVDMNGLIDAGDQVLYWGPGSSVREGFDQHNDTRSVALFGQFNYWFAEETQATLGLRYSHERKVFANRGYTSSLGVVDLFIAEPFDIETEKSWDAATYRLAVSHYLSEALNVYVSYDRGFKSGGFQGQSGSGETAALAFDPEYANNLELGAKSQWFEDRLRLNLSLYYIDYTDMQVLQYLTVGASRIAVTENAGEAISQGVELEYEWQPLRQFSLSGSYAYNDAHFTDLAVSDGEGGSIDLSGGRLRNAPFHSFSAMAAYTHNLSSQGNVAYGLSYNFRSKTYQDLFNYELNALKARNLVDVFVRWDSSEDNLSLALWIKNLGDQFYRIHSFDEAGGKVSLGLAGLPRQAGMTLTARF